MIGRCHVLLVLGGRQISKNHGGMPVGPCDLEVLFLLSWSSTPLSEIVRLAIFFHVGSRSDLVAWNFLHVLRHF